MKKRGFLCGLWIGVVVFMIWSPAIIYAGDEKTNLGDTLDKVSVGFEQYLFYRADNNPYYGADVPGATDSNTAFAEVFSKVSFSAEKDLGWTGLESQLKLYYAETISGPDLYGFPDGDDFGVDQAWVKMKALGGKPFDLTIGSQDIEIEKKFVVGQGQGAEAAYWFFCKHSFPFAVRLDGDFGNLRGSAFWAMDKDYFQDGIIRDDVELFGLSLHYDVSETAFIYGGYYNKADRSDYYIDSETGAQATTPDGDDFLVNNDTQAYDIGAQVGFGGLLLEGEYVLEKGDAGRSGVTELDRDASAWFAAATYTLPAPFAPFVSVQYNYFSGDDDPLDDKDESYDPMFQGNTSWNRWVIGELIGEAQLPNINRKDFIVSAGFCPLETMMVSAHYIRHKLAEKNYFGTPLDSDEYATEYNLFVDWMVNENLIWGVGGGYTSPDDVAELIYGDDEEATFVQTMMVLTF